MRQFSDSRGGLVRQGSGDRRSVPEFRGGRIATAPTSNSTFAILKAHGNEAQTKILTACCDSIFQSKQIYQCTRKQY
jgi:hypothetical protein